MGYSRPRLYSISHQNTTAFNPADATAYYAGGHFTTWGTGATARRIYIPFSGVLRACIVRLESFTTSGSNEAWTISVTDGTTTQAVATLSNTDGQKVFANYNMSLPVVQGGYIQAVTTTPAWATNPEGVVSTELYIIETA